MHLDVEQIEKSFATISPKLDELTMLFYGDLFTSHPELKPLFAHVDIVRQRSKLAAMLTLIVTNLRRMDVLVSVLRSLGAKHVKYGATIDNYAWTEESLLRSLERVSGDDWDEATARAWATAIGLVCAEMRAGASVDDAIAQANTANAEDLDVLMEIASVPSLSFHRDSLFSAYIEKKKSNFEMDLARDVQQTLIPKDHPTAPGYRFSAFYEPANHVGGDYYDWITKDDGRLCFIFGDVSGKGVPGALIMCRLSGVSKAVLAVESNTARALTVINAHMCDRMPDARFVTLALLDLDLHSHRFTLANAGHLSPVLRKRDGSTSILGDASTGTPVGIDKDTSYEATEGPIDPGDTVVLYTDGVDEAMGPGKKMYGTQRLRSCIASATDTDDVGLELLNDVRRFVRGYPQSDDLTILTVSRSA